MSIRDAEELFDLGACREGGGCTGPRGSDCSGGRGEACGLLATLAFGHGEGECAAEGIAGADRVDRLHGKWRYACKASGGGKEGSPAAKGDNCHGDSGSGESERLLLFRAWRARGERGGFDLI